MNVFFFSVYSLLLSFSYRLYVFLSFHHHHHHTILYLTHFLFAKPGISSVYNKLAPFLPCVHSIRSINNSKAAIKSDRQQIWIVKLTKNVYENVEVSCSFDTLNFCPLRSDCMCVCAQCYNEDDVDWVCVNAAVRQKTYETFVMRNVLVIRHTFGLPTHIHTRHTFIHRSIAPTVCYNCQQPYSHAYAHISELHIYNRKTIAVAKQMTDVDVVCKKFLGEEYALWCVCSCRNIV